MQYFFRLLVLGVFVTMHSASALAEQKLDEQIKTLIEQIKKKANLKFDATTPQSAIEKVLAAYAVYFSPFNFFNSSFACSFFGSSFSDFS